MSEKECSGKIKFNGTTLIIGIDEINLSVQDAFSDELQLNIDMKDIGKLYRSSDGKTSVDTKIKINSICIGDEPKV